MGQPQVADPYYYASYMPFQAADASAGGWPTGRDAAAAMSYGYGTYAPMTADYMTGRSMFGQYDYNWFPGFDYGAAAWSASVMPVQQSTAPQKGNNRSDYVDQAGSAGYYEVDSSNGVVGMNGGAAGASSSGISAVEQGVKSMKVIADDDGVVERGGNSGSGSGSYSRSAQLAAPTKKSWANIASQPARPAGRPKIVPRAPVNLSKSDVGAGSAGSWENKTGPGQTRSQAAASGSYAAPANATVASTGGFSSRTSAGGTDSAAVPAGGAWSNSESSSSSSAANASSQYNPKEFDLNPKAARFFVIKSFSEDDIHRSIKYGIWCSTEYGNKRLDTAFREREGKGPIYLFYSVNGSGHFCGVAQMSSPIDYQKSAGVWAQDKWKGQFEVRWIYVKDVPNSQLRHIKLENNEGKPVTNSRDTQEVPPEKGKQVLRVIHQYRHTTSIFDDFQHYEKQQLETKKV